MDSRMREPLAAAARAAALALAIVVVTATVTGWLYWVRAGVAAWPGPQVRDALALDELPRHDSVPLVVYAAAFGVGGVALGLVARALRYDRLAAGLSLAAGTGAWLFLADALCLFVVRQVPAGAAFHEASGLQPIYLAAGLAGACGALLGRSTRTGRVWHTLLAWMVAGGGLLDLGTALYLRAGFAVGLIERLGPVVVRPVAHVLLVPVGVLLLLAARGLTRRSRRAWQLAVALLGLSAVLQLLRGPDYPPAIVTALVAVALIARRQDFPFRGDPAAEPPALLRLTGLLLLAVGYGVMALWVYRMVSGSAFSPQAALTDTARALAGLPPRAEHLPRGFSRWFTISVLSIAVIGVIWAAEVWIRPWRQRLLRDAGGRERATSIVRRWGGDTLAPFALRSDKDWFFVGQTLIAYRVIRGVALVSGDPVGPAGDAGRALDMFLGYARARGWRVAILGASGRFLELYRDRGLHPVYHGDEAVIDTVSFSLDGREMRSVRQAVHRLQRHGYQAQAVMAGELTPALRTELAAVDREWLPGGIRKGFTMELDDLFRLTGDDAMFVVGRDEQGRVAGFAHLAVCGSSRSLSLSSMPRRRDTPNGFDAWLIVTAVRWARSRGFVRLSLNFCPFAGLLAEGAPRSLGERLRRGALLRLKRVLSLQLDNLLMFNGHFGPGWVPRYVVVERRADLPRVALDAMAAEGYLPLAAVIRGVGWSPRAGQQGTEPPQRGQQDGEPSRPEPAGTGAGTEPSGHGLSPPRQ
jgi:lysyl-tRNA synthetase, class II